MELTVGKYTEEQVTAIHEERINYGAVAAGSAVGGGFAVILSIIGIVASFVGGLLGWLLIMKKKVLQCTSCQAVVNAS